jgi:DNA-binding CsgD family transcriptional regulator
MHELTDQDRNVLRLIVAGKSNQQISDELSIRHEAVRFHVRRLFESYGVHTRSELLHQLLHQRRRYNPISGDIQRHDHKERP